MQQLTSHYLVLQPSHFPSACSITQIIHKETWHGLFRGRAGLYCIIIQCFAQQSPDHTSCKRGRTSSLSTLMSGAETCQLPRQLHQKEAPLVWKYSPWGRDNLSLLKGLSSMCFWFSHLFPLVPLQLFLLWPYAVKASCFHEKESCFHDSTTIFGLWRSKYVCFLGEISCWTM